MKPVISRASTPWTHPKQELRRHTRLAIDREPMELAVRGTERLAARILNLSEGGLAVETRAALPEHAQVRFSAPGFPLSGSAIVKHCVRVRGRYRSGLAIAPDSTDPKATLTLERLSNLFEIELVVLTP